MNESYYFSVKIEGEKIEVEPLPEGLPEGVGANEMTSIFFPLSGKTVYIVWATGKLADADTMRAFVHAEIFKHVVGTFGGAKTMDVK